MNSLLLAFALATAPAAAVPVSHPPFEIGSIMLLQPDWLIGQRANAAGLSKTIKRVEAIAATWSRGVEGGDQCNVYVALRPARQFRTWTACASADGTTLDALVATQLAATDVADVSEGTVVLSLQGASSWSKGGGADRFPAAWAEAAGGESMEMEALVDRAWPKAPTPQP